MIQERAKWSSDTKNVFQFVFYITLPFTSRFQDSDSDCSGSTIDSSQIKHYSFICVKGVSLLSDSSRLSETMANAES